MGVLAEDPEPLARFHRRQRPLDEQMGAPVESERPDVDLRVGSRRR
jgi:hypothetical protein